MMTETTAFTVDTDDEYSPDIGDVIARDDSEEVAKTSCCARVCRKTTPLSVQSGDIIWLTSQRESEEVPKSGFYNFVFPILHGIVRVLFFKERLPITACFVFLFFIITLVVWSVVVTGPLRPSVNLSIKSFQIPDHESSIHWDAYQAAKEGDFSSHDSHPTNTEKNTEKSYAHSNLLDFYRRPAELKSTSSDCPTYISTQSKLNHHWLMDIVYKAPKGETLLTVEKIKYMHAIEERIYNNANYPNFCPKTLYKTACDPVSSLLTYLYPRDSYGNYIYPANDGLIPETEIWNKLKETITGDSRVLWYTGGYVGANYSVELLRAQVRIGSPLPFCGTMTQDEQHNTVTEFLISLTPDLEKSSRKDLQVLYGGTDIFDYEVDQAIYHDLQLVWISVALVLVVVFTFTGTSFEASLMAMGVNTTDTVILFVPHETLADTSVSIACQFDRYVTTNFLLGLQIYHFFGLLWIGGYFLALGECTLAGAFASWYWAFRKPKDVPLFAVLGSFGRAILFHSGSLAFGALIIAILQLIRAIFAYIKRKLKGREGTIGKALLCIFQCCLWCLEKFLKYINRQAYIEIAIYGYDFCTAACKVIKLLIRNILTTAVKDRIVAFLLFLGKIAIMGGIGVLAYLGFGPYEEQGRALWGRPLNYYLIPVIILIIAAYFISSAFLGVYHMAVDTIYICALEDLERNNGKDRPYFMSEKLMKLLNVKNKVEQPDGGDVRMESIENVQ